jgi:hypothetical protein
LNFVPQIQTKVYQSFPHNKKGWAGLVYTMATLYCVNMIFYASSNIFNMGFLWCNKRKVDYYDFFLLTGAQKYMENVILLTYICSSSTILKFIFIPEIHYMGSTNTDFQQSWIAKAYRALVILSITTFCHFLY